MTWWPSGVVENRWVKGGMAMVASAKLILNANANGTRKNSARNAIGGMISNQWARRMGPRGFYMGVQVSREKAKGKQKAGWSEPLPPDPPALLQNRRRVR